MFSREIVEKGLEAGIPTSQIPYLVACVHSKSQYLAWGSALTSCLKAYADSGEHPLEVEPGEEELKSGTKALD
jgi:hypothetical protein